MLTSPTNPRALIIDPDDRNASRVGRLLSDLGLEVTRSPSACVALGDLHQVSPTVVVISDDVADLPADQVLRQLHAATHTSVLLLTDRVGRELPTARSGTNVALEKTAPDTMVRGAIEALLADATSGRPAAPIACDLDRAEFFRLYSGVFHRSVKMRSVERIVLQMGASDAPATIRGEGGVGKTLVARAVHYFSDRSEGPWLTASCYGLPPETLAVELPRRFALAHRGTLVLEDVDRLPGEVQGAILRVMRDREVYPDRPGHGRPVDVRVVATTSRDLEALVAAGSFRSDLYYHVNELALTIPPLRDRPEEIPALAEDFRARFMAEYRRDRSDFSEDLARAFVAYPWPGNVRELKSLVKRYVVLGGEPEILAELRTRSRTIGSSAWTASMAGETGLSLKEIGRRAAQRAEKAALLSTLERVNWNRAEAARLLKISYKTLLNKLNHSPVGTGRHERKS